MSTKITSVKNINKTAHKIYLINKTTHSELKEYKRFISSNLKAEQSLFFLKDEKGYTGFVNIKKKKDENAQLESSRMLGAKLCGFFNVEKISEFGICNLTGNTEVASAVVEGAILANYQFLKYKKDKKKLKNTLAKIEIESSGIDSKSIAELKNTTAAVFAARDLVNEPLSFLTATQMAKEFVKLGKSSGVKVEVYNKKKIESLKMGGVLAVNKGSIDPPTFTIMEYKPKGAKNKQPLVLVGKGVVYDTGGLSLKPSSGMEFMKCDMGGAAAMAGAICAIAKNKLPIHTIALLPATDNRPGGNAYVPGDVITMYDGTTVEVLNTDAEGRMLLADALAYAKKYKPMLVLEASTLTGASVRTLGPKAVAAMGNVDDKTMKIAKDAGYKVHERVAEMPFWEDYKAMLKSNIADLKNIGGPVAGHITAGKFLEHFTDYDFIHFDIAPMAWLQKKEGYRTNNASGVGVRLFYEIAKQLAK